MRSAWVLVVALLLTGAVAVGFADEVIWKIGQPDGKYAELAVAGNHAAFSAQFSKGVRFHVGRDDPAQAWPFIHPGPVDVWAGGRRHPFTIHFDLPAQPAGSVELRIALVSAHPHAPPAYMLRVNDHQRQLAVQPGPSDDALTDPAAGRHQTQAIVFDASLLKSGPNRIRLECLDGSWLIYDALQLVQRDRPAQESLSGVRVQPTAFFVRRQGELRRLVQVIPQGSPLFQGGTIQVEINGRRVTQQVPADPFGTAAIDVALPDQPSAGEGRLSLAIEDKVLSTAFQLKPVRKWKVFVVPASHVDVGYTHLQPEAAGIHSKNIDRAVELARKYATFKWNTESAWVLQHYLATRSESQIAEMVELTRSGRLGVEAFHSNLLTGLCSDEELFRSLYYSQALAGKYQWPRVSATLTDAPSHVWSVPSVLADTAVRYLSMGINPTRAPLLTYGKLHEKGPVWWEGPDGAQVLAHFHHHYAQAQRIRDQRGLSREKISQLIAGFEQRGEAYPYDAFHLHGAYGDNRSLGEALAQIVQQWNQTYAYPQVMLTTNDEFFEYIERDFAEHIPTVRGDGGSYWEDGAASSARQTAINRDNARQVVGVEALWALLHANCGATYPHRDLALIWNNILLYDEHTWGAHNSISQPELDFVTQQFAVKAKYAVDGQTRIAQLLDQAMSQLGAALRGDGSVLLVVNPAPLAADKQIVVVEGKRYEVSVPGFGYRAIPVAEAKPLKLGQADATNHVIESAHYRITVDPQRMAITSLLDRQAERELLDTNSPWLGNQFIYCAGGENSTAIQQSAPGAPKFALFSPQEGKLSAREIGPGTRSLVLEASGRLAPLAQSKGNRAEDQAADMTPKLSAEITVYDHDRRIDIVNRLTKIKTYEKEALFFAFPFAAQKPAVDYEVGGAVIRADRDWLPGACKDWFSVQDWVRVRDLSESPYDIIWSSPDAPLIQLCEIQTGKWLKELAITNGTILSYALNNYWFTNYQAGQGGDFVFRFSITSGPRMENATATRFGRTAGRPLLARIVQANPAGSLPPEGILAEVEPHNVIIQALKQAEDGKGIVVRLREVCGKTTEARLRLPLVKFHTAHHCDGLEQPQTQLATKAGVVQVKVKPFGTATLRMQ